MKKAILMIDFTLLEVFTDINISINEHHKDDFTHFLEGDEVLVLMEFEDRDGEEQCVIFSEELEESTTVSKLLLDFID